MKFLIAILFLLPAMAHAQSGVSTSYIRLSPTALPVTCRQGDLRVDSSSFFLQMCNNSNTWVPFTSGGVITIGTIDGNGAATNGLSVNAGAVYAQSASSTKPGLVNNTTQSFSGQKTFTTGLTGALTGNASTVTTNANTTGDVTSVGNVTTLAATSNATITTLSGLTTAANLVTVGTIGTGTWAGTTVAVNHGGTGTTTSTGSGNVVLSTSPTLVSPILGTPTSGVATNLTGTASGLTAGLCTAPATGTGHGAVTLNSSGVFQSVAPGTAGNTIQSNGTDWISAAGGGGVSAWVGSNSYNSGTYVNNANNIYTALSSFTSAGTFAADVASRDWALANSPTNGPNLMLTGTNFEDNTVGGFTAIGCATITNGLPGCVGTGGGVLSTSNGGRSPGANTTAAAVSGSSPIDGSYSLNLATSGAGTIGDGYVSKKIQISPAYQAKALTLKLKYQVASGTPVLAGTSANTYAAAIYDVTNNQFLGMSGAFNFVQGTGVGDYLGTFQTNSTTTDIQVFIYSPIAPTGASSLLLDNLYLGQQVAGTGPTMGDWVAYTPSLTTSGGGAITLNATSKNGPLGFSRHVGDSLEIFITFRNGSGGGASGSAGSVYISIPSGLSIDSTKLNSDTQLGPYVGNANISAPTVTGDLGVYNSTANFLAVAKAGGSFYQVSDVAANFDINIHAMIPIAGWSSNSVQSSDTDTRVVAASYYMSSGQTPGAATQINYDTKLIDTHGAVTTGAGAWKFTSPVTGIYSVAVVTDYSSGSATYAQLYKNGSAVSYLNYLSTGVWSGSAIIALNAGDYIDVRTANSVALGGSGAPYETMISINRLSGPAVIAASDSVNFHYSNTAGTAVSTSLSTDMVFPTMQYDSSGAVTSGVFKAPTSGKFKFTGKAVEATTTLTTSQQFALFLYKNGSLYTELGGMYGNGGTNSWQAGGSDTLSLLQGDTVSLRVYSDTTSALSTTAFYNYFSGERVGN